MLVIPSKRNKSIIKIANLRTRLILIFIELSPYSFFKEPPVSKLLQYRLCFCLNNVTSRLTVYFIHIKWES